MEPWYKVATPRKEVREGRSFNPGRVRHRARAGRGRDGAGGLPRARRSSSRAPASRGRCASTRAWCCAGSPGEPTTPRRCSRSSPSSAAARRTRSPRCTTWRRTATPRPATTASPTWCAKRASRSVPKAKVAVFVGNAWDPQPGRETPWIDIARQLAGDKGVEALGPAAKTTPPGTEAIARVFQAAGAPVLLLFDEVLNYLNRHRGERRIVPRLHPEPDRRHHRHHARRGGDQPAAQPGRDDRRGIRSGRTRSRRWCGASPRT